MKQIITNLEQLRDNWSKIHPKLHRGDFRIIAERIDLLEEVRTTEAIVRKLSHILNKNDGEGKMTNQKIVLVNFMIAVANQLFNEREDKANKQLRQLQSPL
jgi:hypothetical protein